MTETERKALRKKHVGTWLRERRIDAKLTQWDVARAMGFTTAQFVSNWERGVACPPDARFADLAKTLGVPAKEIVERVYECREQELVADRRAALQAARKAG